MYEDGFIGVGLWKGSQGVLTGSAGMRLTMGHAGVLVGGTIRRLEAGWSSGMLLPLEGGTLAGEEA